MTTAPQQIFSEETLMEILRQSGIDLPQVCYSQTRCVDAITYSGLQQIELCFEPYFSIAKQCGMSSFEVLRSPATQRCYIGNINRGGHAPRHEIRPVRLKELSDSNFLVAMLDHPAYGQGLSVSLEDSYPI